MSWTEVFPVFDDDLVAQFFDCATENERLELEEWYGIDEVINEQQNSHIVSFSLFWKNVSSADPDLPPPSRELMKNARALGLSLRFDPWQHYVAPLLIRIPTLRRLLPRVTFRVHLASDMKFLIPDLVKAGCDVRLMKSSSIRFAPGGLWRFLPFGEEGKLVTVADVDRIADVADDVARTEAMAAAGLGCWRVPVADDLNGLGEVSYLPMIGCQSGMKGGMPIRTLLDAFTWHCRRGTMPDTAAMPNCSPKKITKTVWPDYGFDEWFLTAAVYPRVAQAGILTFVGQLAKSMLLTLDIEYATWSNSNSQLIYFPVEGCCGPAAAPAEPAPIISFTALEQEIPPVAHEEIKLGLLFLTNGALHHPRLWENYLDQGGGSIRSFCHPTQERLLAGTFLEKVIIRERHPTKWGDISLVRAMMALMRAAVADPDLTHFVFASESCIPIRPAADLIELLSLDGRSRFRYLTWPEAKQLEPEKISRMRVAQSIPKDKQHFHPQWVLLERKAVMALIENDMTHLFEMTTIPDESYIGTVLAMSGWDLATSVVRQNTTWCHWTRGAAHPAIISKITPRLEAEWLTSGCFFSRKVARDASGLRQAGVATSKHREGLLTV